MSLRPKANYIFLDPIDRPVSSLLIPPKLSRKMKNFFNGKVIAKGPAVHEVDLGDTVAYDKHMGIEIELEEKKLVIIKPGAILAVE